MSIQLKYGPALAGKQKRVIHTSNFEDQILVTGNLDPSIDLGWDLGQPPLRWRTLNAGNVDATNYLLNGNVIAFDTITASNVGIGANSVGVFKQKVLSNLEFKGVIAGSNKISVIDDTINNNIKLDVNTANIDHNLLFNYVPDEHIDHGGVYIIAGDGLSGGGNIIASRTLTLDVNNLSTDVTPNATVDYIPIYNAATNMTEKVLLCTLFENIDCNVNITGNINVSGVGSFNSNVNVNDLLTAGSLVVSGDASVAGNLTVGNFSISNCVVFKTAMIQTTTITAGTTIFSYQTIPNTVYLIKARVLALNSTHTTGAAFDLQRSFKNNAGVLTFIPTIDQVNFRDSTQYNVAYVLSGTQILLNVIKTTAADTINWSVCLEIYQFTP